MSKAFADVLYEGFENNAALRLPADHLLLILRRAGATISVSEGAKLIRYLGVDAMGYVDARKFCAWFEGIEQEPRFAKLLQTALAPRSADEDAEMTLQPQRESSHSADASDAPSGTYEQGNEEVHGAPYLNDDGADHLVGEGPGGDARELRHRRSFRFDRHVTSEDGDGWLLASADKYTLPVRRRLTEHEKLKASFIHSLNKVKARLELSPVNLRPELRAKSL
eukprot:TRINITY_DN11942_c0_g1_i1.p1 TRINITY_DN11942_c0_g1~~TRINITY_DN11942_c0_g1_i1.p1  ORF type:complete len:235 (-),score=39.95 TRINITY_DN11942_c0_g1_i1:240-908(-)